MKEKLESHKLMFGSGWKLDFSVFAEFDSEEPAPCLWPHQDRLWSDGTCSWARRRASPSGSCFMSPTVKLNGVNPSGGLRKSHSALFSEFCFVWWKNKQHFLVCENQTVLSNCRVFLHSSAAAVQSLRITRLKAPDRGWMMASLACWLGGNVWRRTEGAAERLDPVSLASAASLRETCMKIGFKKHFFLQLRLFCGR